MTRLGLCALLFVAACGKDKSGDKAAGGGDKGGGKSAAASVTAEHVAAVNAAIPADMKDKLEFELGTVEDEKGRDKDTYKLAVPKGWKKGFMPGELEPADSDNFGSKTLGKTDLQVGSSCDGACEKKDWAASTDKSQFAPLTGDGKVLKDEKRANGRTLVVERKVSESFPEKDVAVSIRTVWWEPDGSRYYYCFADLGTPAKALADAFEKACSAVAAE